MLRQRAWGGFNHSISVSAVLQEVASSNGYHNTATDTDEDRNLEYNHISLHIGDPTNVSGFACAVEEQSSAAKTCVWVWKKHGVVLQG